MKEVTTFLCLLFLLTGCKLSSKDSNDLTQVNLKASCDIQNVTLSYLECIEFYEDFTGNSEDDCDDAQDRNSLSLKSHHDSDSATECWPYSRVGSCQLSGSRVYFYEEGYTAGLAQTECNSLGGTFE